VTRTYPSSGFLPSRHVETRSQSGGREVLTELIETLDLDGRLKPSGEATTETIRTGPNTVQTRRDVFRFGASGQRMLLETTRSEEEILPDGTIRNVQNTWVPDLNGHLGLTSRQIQQTTLISAAVKQTDTAIYRPGINEVL